MNAISAKPTRLDRFITHWLPGWGNRRLDHRVQASYREGVATRLSETWQRQTGRKFGGPAERHIQDAARDRGYNAYDNNPVAETIVNTETENVIGDGLNYHPTSSSPEWNVEAKDKYYAWLETCDFTGMRSGADLQRDIWTFSRVAGDIGWILIADGADSKIQVVPSENIHNPDGKTFGVNLVDGIQFDRNGRPQTFYVLDYDEWGTRSFAEVAARDFVFLPHLARFDRGRGLTCFNTIFERLNQLDQYVNGVSLAAWMATIFGIVFKQQSGAKEMAGLSSLLNSKGDQQRALTVEDGMARYIGNGDDIVQVDAKQPMQNTPDFIRAILRLIGMPFDMPLEVLARDMSTVNFASARIGLNPFYKACKRKATTRFGPRWSRTIRFWLSREAQRARNDPKRWTTAFPPNYWNHDLLPNAWDYTDPVSEAQSDQLQIDMGTKSPQMVMDERGRDSELILRQRTEWAEKTTGLVTTYSTLTRAAAPTTEQKDKEFKQNLTLVMAKHSAQAAVIYNVINLPETLTDAGVQIDPGVDVANGAGVPYLPVEDDAGNLVSGATIQDPQGDLVGGDVELTVPPDAANAAGDGAEPDKSDPADAEEP